MLEMVSPDKIVNRGCMSLMCEIPADPDGMCWKHKIEMLRAMGLIK